MKSFIIELHINVVYLILIQGYQLYQSDPSGNYSGWKATCIGNNSSAAMSVLKQEYKENETNLDQALALAVKVNPIAVSPSKIFSNV